ncbi:MAG: sugar phosphate isomerase/epimerase family protein [Armatimonadota bacterium]|jgi:sugar phosphate isomerase/epimerase
MKLGLLTFNMAAEWDLDEIIEKCVDLGFEGLEFRTQRDHAHGVEIDLSAEEREQVRKKFEDAGLAICGISTGCAFDAIDPDELEASISEARAHLDLAADLNAGGVKVYGNKAHVDEGVPREETIEQIGASLAGLSEYAESLGVQVRFEMHGDFTSPEDCNRIMELAGDGPGICLIYNCNNAHDVDENGSIEWSYRAVADRVGHVHLHDLADPAFPYLELVRLLSADRFDGWCTGELPDSPDRERVLQYFVELWRAYVTIAELE